MYLKIVHIIYLCSSIQMLHGLKKNTAIPIPRTILPHHILYYQDHFFLSSDYLSGVHLS